jgi:2-polyprenyl-3-methyl-5-hydroxy-6-metoxy-1,4-benzoquinol methylase
MTGPGTKKSACRICGVIADNRFYTVREMMFGTGDAFAYFQCSACACLQIAEIPPDISRYYPADYYSFTPKRRLFRNNSIDRAMRRFQDRSTVFSRGALGSIVSRFSPNKKLTALARVSLSVESRVLDVGCGDGWRLSALREIGFRNVLGIDPFLAHDLEHENGVQVLKRSIHQMTGEWDLVMYHHSFEHVPDPRGDLSAVSRLLRKGGCCLIRIPTVSSYAWEHYRENWVQLDAPRHYHLHSLKSMGLLAAECGFVLSAVVFDSTKDQFQGSELYQKGVPLVSGNGVFSRSQERQWKREAGKLNRAQRGDQAAFYLIKE